MRLLDSPGLRSVVRVPPTISVDELMSAAGGRLLHPTSVSEFAGASVDSRRVTPGSLFVALPGERTDGHRFIPQAIAAGASALLVDHEVELPHEADVAVVQVADTLVALQELAARWRRRHAVRVVGITGSTGKTVAKEIVADVCSRSFATLRNEGNLNSETGLPLTLLRLEPEHEVAVLEMSMYTLGEIARLAEIAEPEIGIVLAVHPTHLERAGSIERIAQAKAELPAALPRNGLAVLNADDARVAAMREVTRAEIRTFGLSASAEVRATDVSAHGLAGTDFTLLAPWGERRLKSGTPGRHLVPHALAAVAVAERLGVPMDEVAAALEAGSHAPHRMEVRSGVGGATIVDDTYNASPVSVTAALDFLGETPLGPGRRRLAVLGDMLELGPDEERLHREIGAHAAGIVDALVVVGPRGRWIGDAALAAGAKAVSEADDAEAAAAIVERDLAPGPGDLVLLKASRGIELDRAVDRLVAP